MLPYFLDLADEIERRFDVAGWTSGDAGLWPLARMDLYLDLYWQELGGPPAPGSRVLRAATHLMRPAANLWQQRRDAGKLLREPHPAEVVFLGDGVSLDRLDGMWEDRYGEPLLADYDAEGVSSFVMQAGDMRRAPLKRPTFAANLAEAAARTSVSRYRRPLSLPDHAALMGYLARRGISALSLAPERLARRAAMLHATAEAFARILDRVQPRIAFTVTWYAGLAPAFLLACRRRGVLTVDLQHCPLEGRHKAYRWARLPKEGYALLPAVFWTWKEEDAARLREWASGPWHRGLHGGHPRLLPFFDDEDPRTRQWDASFQTLAGPAGTRDVLVALQTIGGQKEIWETLAKRVAASPTTWRWWIRRHPSGRPEDDALYGRLLSVSGPNIRLAEASALPLSALLRHMSVVLSVSSGVAAEAAAFGVPAIFLNGDLDGLLPAIAALPARPLRPAAPFQPDLGFTLSLLDGMADEYRRLHTGGNFPWPASS